MSHQHCGQGHTPPNRTIGGFTPLAGQSPGYNRPSAPTSYGSFGNCGSGPPPPAGHNTSGCYPQIPLDQGQQQWRTTPTPCTGPAPPQQPPFQPQPQPQPGSAWGGVGFNFTEVHLPGFIYTSLSPGKTTGITLESRQFSIFGWINLSNLRIFLFPVIQPPPPTNPDVSDEAGQGEDGKARRPLLLTSKPATSEEVMEELECYVKKQCCYGPSTEIKIQNIQTFSGFKVCVWNLASMSVVH